MGAAPKWMIALVVSAVLAAGVYILASTSRPAAASGASGAAQAQVNKALLDTERQMAGRR